MHLLAVPCPGTNDLIQSFLRKSSSVWNKFTNDINPGKIKFSFKKSIKAKLYIHLKMRLHF